MRYAEFEEFGYATDSEYEATLKQYGANKAELQQRLTALNVTSQSSAATSAPQFLKLELNQARVPCASDFYR